MPAPMEGRVCVVTGANAGIGRATAEGLAKRGARVVLLCRDAARGEEARAGIDAAVGAGRADVVVVDLSSMADVRRAAAELLARYPQIHVLVNNAAVFLRERQVTSEGFEKTFATNYLSHFLLTHLLLPRLKASAPARIVSVATLTRGLKIDLDDLMSEKSYSVMGVVPATKLALILFTRELTRRLAGTNVTANALHPGLVKTTLLKEMPWLLRTFANLVSSTPEKGAATSIYLASSDEVAGVSGKLFASCKESKMSGPALDDALASRLWGLSAKLVGLDAQAAA